MGTKAHTGRKERRWAPYTCNQRVESSSVVIVCVVGPGSLLFWSLLAVAAFGEWMASGATSLTLSPPAPPKVYGSVSRLGTRIQLAHNIFARGLERALAAERECVAAGFGRVSPSLHFTVKGTWLALRPHNACSHKLHSTTAVTTQQLASATSLSQSPLRAVHCTLVTTSSIRFTSTSMSSLAHSLQYHNGSADQICSDSSAAPRCSKCSHQPYNRC
jgi:hypothetical protein